jgi:hypothetical protein
MQNVSSKVLANLQDKHYIPTGRHRIPVWPPNHHKAFDKLMASLNPSQPFDDFQLSAYKRLKQAYNLPTQNTTPDLYIKIFDDLDTVIFRNKLYRRVYLRWSDLSSHDRKHYDSQHDGDSEHSDLEHSGHEHFEWVRGLTTHSYIQPRVKIELDQRTFGFFSHREIFGVLVHEMLHAYFAIKGKITHGHCEHFAQAAEAIEGRLGFGVGLRVY